LFSAPSCAPRRRRAAILWRGATRGATRAARRPPEWPQRQHRPTADALTQGNKRLGRRRTATLSKASPPPESSEASSASGSEASGSLIRRKIGCVGRFTQFPTRHIKLERASLMDSVPGYTFGTAFATEATALRARLQAPVRDAVVTTTHELAPALFSAPLSGAASSVASTPLRTAGPIQAPPLLLSLRELHDAGTGSTGAGAHALAAASSEARAGCVCRRRLGALYRGTDTPHSALQAVRREAAKLAAAVEVEAARRRAAEEALAVERALGLQREQAHRTASEVAAATAESLAAELAQARLALANRSHSAGGEAVAAAAMARAERAEQALNASRAVERQLSELLLRERRGDGAGLEALEAEALAAWDKPAAETSPDGRIAPSFLMAALEA
jgi:hypothetical protein